MTTKEFQEWVSEDLFSELDGITGRAMFGGYSFYKDGVIFGMIARNALYFKVDESLVPDYESRGSSPFTYSSKNGKEIVMNAYWQVPDEILDDKRVLETWVDRSVAIARKNKK